MPVPPPWLGVTEASQVLGPGVSVSRAMAGWVSSFLKRRRLILACSLEDTGQDREAPVAVCGGWLWPVQRVGHGVNQEAALVQVSSPLLKPPSEGTPPVTPRRHHQTKPLPLICHPLMFTSECKQTSV